MAAFSSSPRRSRRKNGPIIFIGGIVLFVILYVIFLTNSYSQIRQRQRDNKTSSIGDAQKTPRIIATNKVSEKNNKPPQCLFRDYPKHRYYGLQVSPQPDFLRDAEYIYGQLPTILELDTSRVSSSEGKLCVNQTEWLSSSLKNELPFADGTNPSILALSRVPSFSPNHGATFLATVCMTNALCSWKDSFEEKQKYKISSQQQPDTLRTVLLWLNENFKTLHQTSIYLQRNADWGRRNPMKQDANGKFVLELKALDDARLFLHKDKIWISFRDGKAFGYDKQVLNPIHFQENGSAIIKASESIPFCCGRNMALFSQPQVSYIGTI